MNRLKALLILAVMAAPLCAQAAVPLVIGQDFMAVPTNATGQNNNGGYNTFYITNAPAFSDWGVNSHIYIGTHEVAAYCSQAIPPSSIGTISKQPAITAIRVQVGSLGGAAYGTPLDVDIVVGGLHATSNRKVGTTYYSLIVGADAPNKRANFVADYEPLQVTPIDGSVIYVDPAAGSDSNAGDWAHPFATLQSADGFHGALRNATSVTDITNETQPGTQIVLRGGANYTYTPVGDYTAFGNFGRWATILRITGTNPGSGKKQGPIAITSYPGAPGSNANEIAVMDQSQPLNKAGGGFFGPDVNRATELNPYDNSQGWGHQINISWLKVISNPNGPRDGAPFNLNSGMHDFRLVAVDGSWNSLNIGNDGAKCGGWCGNGFRVRTFLNYFHDINGADGLNQNHGIYPDSSVTACQDCTIAFTTINNIGDGNSISVNHSGSDEDSIKNMIVYNNWMQGANKSNFLIHQVESAYVWNNIMIGAGESAVNVAFGPGLATNGMQVFNNTIIDWDKLNIGRGAFWDQGADGTGSWDARNNITVRRSSSVGSGPWYVVNFDTYNFVNDTWWDANAAITQVIPDSSVCGTAKCGGQKSNPKFVAAANNNFTLGATSPAIDYSAPTLGAVPHDFDFMLKPMSGTAWDDGAYERQQ